MFTKVSHAKTAYWAGGQLTGSYPASTGDYSCEVVLWEVIAVDGQHGNKSLHTLGFSKLTYYRTEQSIARERPQAFRKFSDLQWD
jgi:hypothetical protein